MLTRGFLVVCVAAAPALAVDYVVPPAFQNVVGGSTFTGPTATTARTYQWLIHESQLTDLVGLDLTGLTYRNPTSATAAWPAADITFSDYDIYISGSVAPEERSLTFASNVVGTQTQVRSGPLTIPANSFPIGGNPNPFGPTIAFGMPYTYSGGHLLIELRHQGFTGTSRSNDAIAASNTGAGYGTLFSAAWTGSYAGVSGSQGNFTIIQLSAIPAPGSAALLGLGGLLAMRRRR
jgi:hypothetical protein